jgi:hypothetical protein
MPSPADSLGIELTRFLSWYFCGSGGDAGCDSAQETRCAISGRYIGWIYERTRTKCPEHLFLCEKRRALR